MLCLEISPLTGMYTLLMIRVVLEIAAKLISGVGIVFVTCCLIKSVSESRALTGLQPRITLTKCMQEY